MLINDNLLSKLQAETESSYAFLVPVFRNSEEGLLQVIGDQILNNEYRFSVKYFLFLMV